MFVLSKDFILLSNLNEFSILQESWPTSLKYVLNLVHQYPTNGSLWTIAAHSIMSYDNEHQYAPSVPRRLLLSGKKVFAETQLDLNESDEISPATLSLAYLLEGDWKMAKKTALKTARCFPSERGSWAVLGCALWYEYCETKDVTVYNKMMVILNNEVSFGQCSERILNWVHKFLQEVLKHEGNQ